MLKQICAFREAYIKNEEGATAIEYGLIAAGIALAIAVVVFTMGDKLELLFTGMDTQLQTAVDDAGVAAAP